ANQGDVGPVGLGRQGGGHRGPVDEGAGVNGGGPEGLGLGQPRRPVGGGEHQLGFLEQLGGEGQGRVAQVESLDLDVFPLPGQEHLVAFPAQPVGQGEGLFHFGHGPHGSGTGGQGGGDGGGGPQHIDDHNPAARQQGLVGVLPARDYVTAHP